MKDKLRLEIKNIISNETRVEFIELTRRINDLKSQIHCGVVCRHRFTVIRYTGQGYIFQCTNCELEYYNDENILTEKEAKLVAVVFPNQKKKSKK